MTTKPRQQYSFQYIYGPVPSWRLGRSLGIDLLSARKKICNFDCNYCQLGKTAHYETIRKIHVPTQLVIEELKKLPDVPIDYLTFSGRGEPTLAKNFGQTIQAVRKSRKEPIAVLTNSSLMSDKQVRSELALVDFIVAKLDACSQKQFEKINRPAQNVKLADILLGIRTFRKEYPRKKLALQMMFIDENKHSLPEFLTIINQIEPDEIQINTPLRTSPVKPLSPQELLKIKDYFQKNISPEKKINIIAVFDERVIQENISISDADTLKRRGKVLRKEVSDPI